MNEKSLRSKLIRLAASMPKSSDRNAVLTILANTPSTQEKKTSKEIKDIGLEGVKHVAKTLKPLGIETTHSYREFHEKRSSGDIADFTFRIRLESSSDIFQDYTPGLAITWWKSRKSCSFSVFGASRNYHDDHVPLEPAKLRKAMAEMVDWFVKNVKDQISAARWDSYDEQVWSVVTVKDGYATSVDEFTSKSTAVAAARRQGDCYLVKGTQMWNEPLGQIEESSRMASYVFYP